MPEKNELCKNPIICREHGPLVSLNEHADNIFRFLLGENPYDEDPIRDWFKIASGITKVEYFSALFDNSFMYCGPAIDYENEKSKYHESLLLELTLFTYIWGGFEALTDSYTFPPCPDQRGKINAVNFYLKNKFDGTISLLTHYVELVDLLKKYIGLNPWYGTVESIFNESSCSGPSSEGLKAVYKIRNLFAHGSFKFSEPEEFNSTKPFDGRIIHISSRLTLLSIQMILLTLHIDDPFEIEKREISLADGGIDSTTFLKNLHLKSFNT